MKTEKRQFLDSLHESKYFELQQCDCGLTIRGNSSCGYVCNCGLRFWWDFNKMCYVKTRLCRRREK
jgi:hypothetical protein